MKVNEQKSFVCPFDGCGKVFSKSSNLKQHERIHSGDKPFVCNICDRSFCQSGNLLKHKRSHENLSLKWNRQTSEKPFKCTFEGCERSFTAKSSLQTHFKTNHPDNSSERLHYPTQHNPLIDGPPFICCMTTCKEIFLSKATLVEHLTTHHSELQTLSLSNFANHQCMHPACYNKYTLENHENFICEHMAQWYPGLVAENRFLKNTLSTLISCVDNLQNINATTAEQVDLVTIKKELNRLTKPFGNPQLQSQQLQQPMQQPLTLLNPQHFMVQQQLQLPQQQHSVPFAQLSSYQHASHQPLQQATFRSIYNSSNVAPVTTTSAPINVGGNCVRNLLRNYNVTDELSSVARGWQAHQIENVDDNDSINSYSNSFSSSNDRGSSSSSINSNSDNSGCSSNISSGDGRSTVLSNNNSGSRKRSYHVFHNSCITHDNQSFPHVRYSPTTNSSLHHYVNPYINSSSLFNNQKSHKNSNSFSNSNSNASKINNTMHTVTPNTVDNLDSSAVEIIRPPQYHQQNGGFPSHSLRNAEQNRPSQHFIAQQAQPSAACGVNSSNSSNSSDNAPNISLSEAVEFVAVLFDEPAAAVCNGVKTDNNTLQQQQK